VVETPKPAAPAKVEVPATKSADAPKLQGFAVQVGAFRDEDKLEQSREKLAAAGLAHYTERLDSKAGPLTRLRAGPFATRAQAEAALAKLKRATIDGKVVPLP
jgi:DedD protein